MSPTTAVNLIIGADGFIGSHLYRYLAARHRHVLGTHYLPAGRRARRQLLFLDVTKSPASFWRRLPPLKNVFLCIQRGSLDDCRRRPAATAAVNVRGLISALQQVRRLNGTPVFLSSSLVFAGNRRHYSEVSRPRPATVYGRQKLAVEQYIRRHFRHYCIARLTKVFSTSGPGGYVFRPWLQSLRRGQPVRAAADIAISPIWVADVVRAVSSLDSQQKPGVYHFAGLDSGSPAHYARRLARHFHLNEKLVQAAPAATFEWLEQRPRYNLLDDRQTRQALKLKPLSVEAAFDYQMIIGARRHAMLPL